MSIHVSPVKPRQLQKFRWGILEHLPYSPDLSPCDFKAFRPLKKVLRFYLDDEVKEDGQDFLKNQQCSF
ncbi:hypothetical protein TNCV_2320131 [Trichonephila clavipes]|nr:hypothetical protein TNCV_2320131 [Trichonephila clavipes]